MESFSKISALASRLFRKKDNNKNQANESLHTPPHDSVSPSSDRTNFVMDGFTWRLVVRWLDARDVGSASRVCKSWKKMLSSGREGGDLWKQICANTHSENTVQSCLSVQSNWDFRHLTKSLSAGISTEEVPRIPLGRSNLPLSSIFAVVELYRIINDVNRNERRRHIIASWKHDQLQYGPLLIMHADDTGVELTVENPYNASTGSCNDDGWFDDDDVVDGDGIIKRIVDDALRTDAPSLRVTLFRRDNMKSVCILDDETTSSHLFDDRDGFGMFFTWCNDAVEVDGTQAGGRALIVQAEHNFSNTFQCEADVYMEILEEEGFLWHSELKGRERGKQIRKVLSKMPAFKVQIRVFDLEFRCADLHDNVPVPFRTENDMAIALEGLRWRR